MNIQKFRAIYISILVTVTVAVIGVSCWRYGRELISGFQFHIGSGGVTTITNANLASEHEYFSVEAFENIDVEASVAVFTIEYGDEYAVELVYPREIMPEVKVVGDTLYVDTPTGNVQNYSVGTNNFAMIVTVPEGTDFDKINLDINAGDIELDGINADVLTANVDAGNFELKNTKLENLDVNAAAGNIEIKDSEIKGATLEANAGSVMVKNTKIEDIEVKTDLGSVDIKTDFETGKFSSSLGSIVVKGNFDSVICRCSWGSVEITCDNTDAKYDIETDLGSIVVNNKSYVKQYKN